MLGGIFWEIIAEKALIIFYFGCNLRGIFLVIVLKFST